jgi:hypothetical protein
VTYKAGAIGTGEGITTPSGGNNDPDLAERRREGLNTFLLTLSDQQLVTGLAMMVAALARHCSLSYYEFSIVAKPSLAFLDDALHNACCAPALLQEKTIPAASSNYRYPL